MANSVLNNTLLETSEIVLGLVLAGKQSPNMFNPDKMFGDYAKAMKDLREGKKIEDLSSRFGTTFVQSAQHAAKSVNGLGETMDFPYILDLAFKRSQMVGEMQKAIRYAERGEMDKL